MDQLYTYDICDIHVELGTYKDKYKLKDIYESYMSMLLHDRSDTTFTKDRYGDITKHIEYRGSLDHQYNTDLVINHTEIDHKDRYRMRDDIILTWET
jgi:hypothetical protein